MVPYVEAAPLIIGPFRVHPFGVCLVAGLVLGRSLILRRAVRHGFDRGEIHTLCLWMLAGGYAGAHLAHAVLSGPSLFLADPMVVFRSPRGLASSGGFGGALAAAFVFSRVRRLNAMELLARLDVIAFALPAAAMLARMGCALAHDHRGLPSASWLAVRFPEGPRYDLGLIEMVFLLLLALAFRLLDGVQRPLGFFLGLYALSYGLFRIWLDTLHVAPLRFAGGLAAVLAGFAVRAIASRLAGPQRLAAGG